jgi:type II secretory pathway predicted ATPase ExeA
LYLKHFGFREAPFNLTPDPKFFYSSELHREALAALYYGVKHKKGFVVVTGEVGTGKTTCLRKLLRNLEATHHSVFVFNTLLSFDELLETILRDLQISQPGGRVAMLDRLNEFLLEKVRVGHVVSILIDEAQNLTEDVLEGVRLLSNMETDREKLIQIILVGQPELEAKLNRPSLRQLKQRVSLWSRLDCLSAADTEAYIRHRLQIAGYEGPNIFDANSLRLISEHAAGTPRLINSICDNALLTAFAGSQKIVTSEIIREVIRDLRIAHRSESQSSAKSVEQFQTKTVRNIAEPADSRSRTRSRLQEEPAERIRVVRSVRVAGAADVVHNVSLKLESDEPDRPAQERDFRRLKRTEERAAEWDDLFAGNVDARDREVAGSRSENAGRLQNATLIPQEFFKKMAEALTDAMGPMAVLVLRDRIAALGEKAEEFPIVRLPELVGAIKQEILSEALRLRFEEQIATQIQEHSQVAVWRSLAK